MPSLQAAPQEGQFTTGEQDELAQLGMYDERQDAIKRQMARANQLREGIQGGSRGTYGRWGTPLPYTGGQAFADALREGVATYGERRAEKASKAEREAAQRTLGMYNERATNPIDQGIGMDKTRQWGQDSIRQAGQSAAAGANLGADTIPDKLRRFARRFA
jgi:hypothetical protein